MTRKLKLLDTSGPNADRNELSEVAIFECLSGAYDGRKRVIYAAYDLSKSPNSLMYGPNGAVMIVSPTGQGQYPLDKNSKFVFSEEQGLFKFSSGGVEYMIRAIEDDDIPGVKIADDSSKDTEK
jgi:hypothetical protein